MRAAIAISGLLLVAPLILSAPVKADCLSDCLAAQDCSLSYSGACSNALGSCSQQCMGEGSGPAYGAIAYDKASRAFGYAFQFPDADGAADFALKSCAENGDACAIVATFADACAALAAGDKDGGRVSFTVIADDRETAQSQAIAHCTDDGAGSCALEVWSCSFR